VTKRLLLLDGDIFAFQACSAAEQEDYLEDGFTVLWSDWKTALHRAKEKIDGLRERLKADEVVFCLTDSKNWRKDVLTTYKSNRKATRKPIALQKVREELFSHYPSELWEGLEADDVMGILATREDYRNDCEKIIVSEDKDLRTIPATVFNPAKDSRPERVSSADADLWFYAQAIGGDATDGYGGCPNVGTQTALSHLEDMLGYECYSHTFKSGQRKGLTEDRWRKVDMSDYWSIAKSLYAKAGLGEEYALQQARVARILRDEDFDRNTMKPILWRPEHETI
jgi:5'-3' exonuclease